MKENEMYSLLEIQYLKGRLDELHKAIPTITNMDRSRKLDVRLQKYYEKLKSVSELAYHLYQVERQNQMISKDKNKKLMNQLLLEVSTVLTSVSINTPTVDEYDITELLDRIKKQIEKY
jgi:hypothetical protein